MILTDSHDTPDLLNAGLVQAHSRLAAALCDITLLEVERARADPRCGLVGK